MYKYRLMINGIKDFYIECVNYDDAEAVAGALVEHGKVRQSDYDYDADGNYKKIGEHIENAQIVIVMIEEEAL